MFNKKLKERVERLEDEQNKKLKQISDRIDKLEEGVEVLMHACEDLIIKKAINDIKGLVCEFAGMNENLPKAKAPKKEKKPVDKSTSAATTKKKTTKKAEGK